MAHIMWPYDMDHIPPDAMSKIMLHKLYITKVVQTKVLETMNF